MFTGFDDQRLLNMTDQEKRWLDNVKKAFHESDTALQNGSLEDRCLEELFKAVDTAKTLRRSLRGEDTSTRDNKKRFIEFLSLEIPCSAPGSTQFSLQEVSTSQTRLMNFGEVVYAIRCKIHENENLNAAEFQDYHILLDWSVRSLQSFCRIENGKFVCNGYFLWNRLREVLAKFITGIEGTIAFAQNGSFSISIRPDLGVIRPLSRTTSSQS